MVSLLCSDGNSELELSGSPEELRAFGNAIRAFVNSGGDRGTLGLELLSNPAPYARSIETIALAIAEGPVRISVLQDGHVSVSGSRKSLETLAAWFDWGDDSPDGHHAHYEGWPGNEYVAEESVPMVVMVKRGGQSSTA